MKRNASRSVWAGGVLLLAILGMVAAVLWPTGSRPAGISGRTIALSRAEMTPTFSLSIRVSEVHRIDPTMLDCPTVGTCYLTGNPPLTGAPSAENSRGMVVTHNGGRTWHLGGPNVGTTLDCVSADVCFGANGYGRLVRTVNGGKTWTSRSLPGKQGVALSCPTVKDCVVIGSFSDRTEVTTNAGRSWRSAPLPAGLKKFQAFGIQCFASGRCTAIGNILNFRPGAAHPTPREQLVGPTYALYSTDGGLKWHKGGIPAHFRIYTNLSCGTAMDCMALGGDGQSPAIATTDGGVKWHAVTDPGGSVSKKGYWWVSCVGSSECWMVAYQDHGNTLGVVETTDLGHSWRLLKAPRTVSSGSTISCATTTRCYATADLPPGAKTSSTTTTTLAPATQGDNLFLAWRVPAR